MGKIYEQLEYTPYGELWVEHLKTTIEATPFRFTGKERDSETGLYYFGVRYLNPQTSMWLSADPAMGEYIPQAPINDEAKKYNQNLPGMGGVFNYVNLHAYHYAGNNPVVLKDPDGRADGDSLLSVKRADSESQEHAFDVYAIKGGTVFRVDENAPGYGKSIIIKDSDGVYVRYAHLSQINVSAGDTVEGGQVIGIMGNSGSGGGNPNNPTDNRHLHVSVYPAGTEDFTMDNARIINPETYIKGGYYPCNTKISFSFLADVTRADGTTYPHEGLDFSGRLSNLISRRNWGSYGGFSGGGGADVLGLQRKRR